MSLTTLLNKQTKIVGPQTYIYLFLDQLPQTYIWNTQSRLTWFFTIKNHNAILLCQVKRKIDTTRLVIWTFNIWLQEKLLRSVWMIWKKRKSEGKFIFRHYPGVRFTRKCFYNFPTTFSWENISRKTHLANITGFWGKVTRNSGNYIYKNNAYL